MANYRWYMVDGKVRRIPSTHLLVQHAIGAKRTTLNVSRSRRKREAARKRAR